MKNKKFLAAIFTLVLAFALAACGNNDDNDKTNNNDNDKNNVTENNDGNMDNANDEANNADDNMDMHNDSGDVPKDLKAAENPKYKVGDEVIVKADHMEGMKDAKGKVVGAYDTTAYSVTYTPTTGGDKVENHKWVIQQEMKDAGDKKLNKGDEVTLEADHMKGMKDAKATIDSAEDTTVYMIDYTPADGGKEVKNHKWVTESELSAK
ncbi:YdhK family protein [Bacillus sp. 1P06AnD]|uniref:YdhK family protein n=1 Tax=Bacillus sp. 1P06AnD TaxID=3132208 RepID=UPI0039A2831D